MNELYNFEKVIDYVNRAVDNLKGAEDYWGDTAPSEELDKMLEVKEELEDILYGLERRLEKLQDEI